MANDFFLIRHSVFHHSVRLPSNLLITSAFSSSDYSNLCDLMTIFACRMPYHVPCTIVCTKFSISLSLSLADFLLAVAPTVEKGRRKSDMWGEIESHTITRYWLGLT